MGCKNKHNIPKTNSLFEKIAFICRKSGAKVVFYLA